ncbi:hypothetical protein COMA1_50196 [Candidatus Nitrospira nitrosa]|uniref:Transposase DDE domain-containing protein n=1 Tax=Candidatus Nitrospira nitrosa TaxID=1742972 RepID=A0A0S4LMX6_9BACT|nr:hypothetical protein COMA1_50196 [Candidatus Nitrospira nitrosa]
MWQSDPTDWTISSVKSGHLRSVICGQPTSVLTASGLLRSLVRCLRRAFPGAALRVRVDGGFAGNDWLEVLETQRVEYVVGVASNARLVQRAGRLLGEAYGLSKYSGHTEHVYSDTLYAAGSWSRRRRVIIKAEVVRLPGRDPKCNPRFVVTNLRETPATVYASYCQRGDVENRLKELHDGLAWAGRVARGFGPINSGCCRPRRRMCCSRSCAARLRAPPVPRRRSRPCGSGC